MPFLKGGRHLWTHFSQTFSDKNEEFLCSSERKFPELFKTHPPFVYCPLLVHSMACQTLITVFFGTPCTSEMRGPCPVILTINAHSNFPCSIPQIKCPKCEYLVVKRIHELCEFNIQWF